MNLYDEAVEYQFWQRALRACLAQAGYQAAVGDTVALVEWASAACAAQANAIGWASR